MLVCILKTSSIHLCVKLYSAILDNAAVQITTLKKILVGHRLETEFSLNIGQNLVFIKYTVYINTHKSRNYLFFFVIQSLELTKKSIFFQTQKSEKQKTFIIIPVKSQIKHEKLYYKFSLGQAIL